MAEARKRRVRLLRLRHKGKKLREIAKLWGITKSRASDINVAALADLAAGRITREEIEGE